MANISAMDVDIQNSTNTWSTTIPTALAEKIW